MSQDKASMTSPTDTPKRLSDADLADIRLIVAKRPLLTNAPTLRTIAEKLLSHIAALTAPLSQGKVSETRINEIIAEARGDEGQAVCGSLTVAQARAAITQALTESSGQGMDEVMEHALKDVIVGALLEYSGTGQGVDDMLFDVASDQADKIIAAMKMFGHLPLPVSADGREAIIEPTDEMVMAAADFCAQCDSDECGWLGCARNQLRAALNLNHQQPSDTGAGK